MDFLLSVPGAIMIMIFSGIVALSIIIVGFKIVEWINKKDD